jgi:hypothetical protein
VENENDLDISLTHGNICDVVIAEQIIRGVEEYLQIYERLRKKIEASK